MADIAASVLARLKNKAAETGRSNQLCLQLFCQEEFLRRLQQSRYADNLVLKGGLFVYALTDFDSRVTVDVDFLLRNIPNTPEQLKPVLEEIITADTGNDFLSFEIGKIEPIAVTKKYAGIGATIIVRIKNTRTVFSIDFGVGDVIVPHQEKRKIPTQLDGFTVPVVSTYSVETTIAEKLDAILSLMEYSSRMKDYYDILYLSRKFDFDGQILRDAIYKTFVNRSRSFTIEQFDEMLALGGDTAMRRKWSAFLKKVEASESLFDDVVIAIGVFLREVITAVIQDDDFSKTWDAAECRWQQGL
jgi:predicted nucleotidyltransferase component of viral defense system